MAILKVRVTPKSSREEIQYSEGVARVWVRAAPEDGNANEALCTALAKRLRVAKSLISIVKGHSSRSKILCIEGIDEREMQRKLAGS